jgi:hypothetical protein
VVKIHEKGDILGIAENCPQNSRDPKALVDFSQWLQGQIIEPCPLDITKRTT